MYSKNYTRKTVVEKSYSKTRRKGPGGKFENAVDCNFSMKLVKTSRNSQVRTGRPGGATICPWETKISRADVRAQRKCAKNIVKSRENVNNSKTGGNFTILTPDLDSAGGKQAPMSIREKSEAKNFLGFRGRPGRLPRWNSRNKDDIRVREGRIYNIVRVDNRNSRKNSTRGA